MTGMRRRTEANGGNRAATGGWVRWGDEGTGEGAILKDFIQPVIEAGRGGDLKNLYNLYVYFWRWALWKVFEHTTARESGIVSFITASSYLDGDAFLGMRGHMRRQCDEIWIIDIGGEGRGTRQDENVFNIQTPVAIAVTVRYGEADPDTPARVHYVRFEGSRAEKLKRLDEIESFADLEWEACPEEWNDPFRPAGKGVYFDWPLLTDLMPWQHSGAQLKRTWPIAPDEATLKRRWRALLKAENRALVFKETRDRKIHNDYPPILQTQTRGKPIGSLSVRSQVPTMKQYAYRSFDRQFVIADSRVGDYFKPVLWKANSENQVFGSSVNRVGDRSFLVISWGACVASPPNPPAHPRKGVASWNYL